jgi:hypothetical protein
MKSASTKLPLPAESPLAVIRLIHRADDGFVTLHSKMDDVFNDLLAVRAGELGDVFKGVRGLLERDAYFSVNAFFCGWGESKVVPGLPRQARCTESLRYLNACFADLDCHRAGLTARQAKTRVRQFVRAGTIPLPSIITESGRGLWLFWLLRDDDDGSKPPRAWPEAIRWYGRIQNAMCGRLSSLAPDAKDAARITRVPGSLNGKSGARVSCLVQTDAAGRLLTYTLAEIGAFLGVSERGTPARPKATLTEAGKAAKRPGYTAMQANRLRQFQSLRALRGGFSDGCRNRAAMLYVLILRQNGIPPVEIEKCVEELARECHPPLRRCACRDALRGGRKHRRISDRLIADWLLITPDEAAQLEGWSTASHYPTCAPPPSPTRADRTDARRRLIREIVTESGGRVLPTRAMVEALDQFGQKASPQTVATDYGAMGLRASRNGAGRPPPKSLSSFSACSGVGQECPVY